MVKQKLSIGLMQENQPTGSVVDNLTTQCLRWRDQTRRDPFMGNMSEQNQLLVNYTLAQSWIIKGDCLNMRDYDFMKPFINWNK